MKGLKFLSVFALAMMVAVAFSCANQEKAKNAEAEEENVEETAIETKCDSTATEVMTDIVAKAKAEGANWSIDEWKAAFTKVCITMKQLVDDSKSLSESMAENNSAELVEQFEKLQKEYEPVVALMDEFTEIAKSTENGLAVHNDEDFNNQLQEKYNLKDL